MQQDSTQRIGQLARQVWHKSAPERIRRAYRKGDRELGWTRWCSHLAKRTSPVSPGQLWPSGENALLWASDEAGIDAETRQLLVDLQQSIDGEACWNERSERWVEVTSDGTLDVCRAIQAIGWSRALPEAASKLESTVWWNLLDHLAGLAQEAAEMPLEGAPLIQQLVGGELAFTLAYLFPEISPCRKGTKRARKVLSEGLLELLDGEGLPHSRILDDFRPLMACWTRCRILGGEMEKDCVSRAAGRQYEWGVRAALRLSRADGSQVFSTANGHRNDTELLAAAIDCGGDEGDEAIASLTLPGRGSNKGRDDGRLPSPADHSGWASVTILQPAWGAHEPKLAMSYPGQEFRIELSQQRELLLDGAWSAEIQLDGEPLEPKSEWQELCWVSDADVDYLELEIRMGQGVRIQRHVAMAREDRFLLLADAVLNCPDGAIGYCGRLSLAEDAGLAPAEETHEAYLMNQKAAALVLPLALPEWRLEHSPGQLTATREVAEYRLSGDGGAVFAPLFFDLKPGRMTRPFTWRRLTVAESLEVVPPHVAAGYRVAAGKAQWLIYRSLAPAANRTLLGHNLATEMLVARFDRQGEVDPLVEIEGE